MPFADWFIGRSRHWFENDRTDKRYKSVLLYGVGESYRTAVYFIKIGAVDSTAVDTVKQNILELENKFASREYSFNFYLRNCSTFVAQNLYAILDIHKVPLDVVPVCLFDRIYRTAKKKGMLLESGKLQCTLSDSFRVHRLCIGICSLHAEKTLDVRYCSRQDCLSSISR